MITTVVVVTLCSVALATIGWLALRPADVTSGDDVAKLLVKINLPAFINLLDPGQQAFLRQNLSPPDYRSVLRERNRVALRYAKKISHNTAVLTRWAELARTAAIDPKMAKGAAELATLGIRTRFYVLGVMLLLYCGYLFPDLVELRNLAARYEALADRQHALQARG